MIRTRFEGDPGRWRAVVERKKRARRNERRQALAESFLSVGTWSSVR